MDNFAQKRALYYTPEVRITKTTNQVLQNKVVNSIKIYWTLDPKNQR